MLLLCFMSPSKERLDKSEALTKLRSYCNYRERCHKEVQDKLYDLGVWKKDSEEVIMHLMDENLLNEERYARSYVRGHFYNKDWGKGKIRYELKRRFLHDKLIEMAMMEIEEDDYSKSIEKLIEKKLRGLTGNKWNQQQQVAKYLQGKGYHFSDFRGILKTRLKL